MSFKQIFKTGCAVQSGDTLEVAVDDQGDFCFELLTDASHVILTSDDARKLARRILGPFHVDATTGKTVDVTEPLREGRTVVMHGGGGGGGIRPPGVEVPGVSVVYAGGAAPGPARPFPTLMDSVISESVDDSKNERIGERLSFVMCDPDVEPEAIQVSIYTDRESMLRFALNLMRHALDSGEEPEPLIVGAMVTTDRK